MRIIPTRSLSLALTACTLVPSLLLAQTPPMQPPMQPRMQPPAQRPLPRPMLAPNAPEARGGGRGGRGPGARGGEGRLHPAAMLLRARTQLALTAEQVARLDVLAAAPAPKSNASDMMRARADLLDATQGDGNLAGARAALDKLSRLRNDQLLARIKTQQEVRAVLTPTQRAKVDNMRRQLRNRVGANRQGGMRQGGMRQGGMRQGRGQMGPGMMPGMMPGNPQGPQPPQGRMPRMRRGGDMPDTAPPVPPAN
jgi:Spy/CpxP family protein refolding chaperone